VIVVFMGVKHLGDVPALILGGAQAFFMIQRIDGQGLASVGTYNQVIEVPVRVAGPNLLNDHRCLL